MIFNFDTKAYLKANPKIEALYNLGKIKDIEEYVELFALIDIELGKQAFHKDFEPFNEKKYLDIFVDVKEKVIENHFLNGFEHFCKYGYSEIVSKIREWPLSKKLRKHRYEYNILKEIKEINWEDYKKEYKIDSNPIEYFLENYKKDKPKFKNFFDMEFFLRRYPEFELLNINPLAYFVLFKEEDNLIGISSNENFILTTKQSIDYAKISSYNINWSDYFRVNNIEKTPNLDAIKHYIIYCKTLQPIISPIFDTKLYFKLYPDIKDSTLNPLIHYMEYGREEGRVAWQEEKFDFGQDDIFSKLSKEEQEDYTTILSFELNWNNYFKINNISQRDFPDPISHYIKNYKNISLIIENIFDTEIYFELYPDIKESGLNPLIHYFKYGKNEGRVGWIDISKHIKEGKKLYKKDKDTFIVVSHESSATGAPLVSLNIAQELSKNFNVINIVLKKSNLHNDFLECCEFLIEDLIDNNVVKRVLNSFLEEREIKTVICNSVETFNVLLASFELGLPTLSLIHEFSEYTRPKGKIAQTLFYATNVIFPATLLQKSAKKEIKEIYGIETDLNNIYIKPQGKLLSIPEGYGKNETKEEIFEKLKIEDKNTKIVTCAGGVQIRKGIDLFLSVAKQTIKNYKGKCKFIWVGGGYNPKEDLGYSVWLENQVKELGDDFIFLGHQKNLDVILEITDVFALTSRLDPFPNVVIDAMQKDVHIACFKNSTGCVEFLEKNSADSSISDYLDTFEMSSQIIDYFNKKEKKKINANIVKEKLNFLDYLNFIIDISNKSYNRNIKKEKIVKELIKNNLFDNSYANLDKDDLIACRFYVETALKGVHLGNPKVGFNEKEWIDKFGDKNIYQVALYEAYLNNKPLKTHNVYSIKNLKERYNQTFAIHIHLYYTDLAKEFANYLSKLSGVFDILITITKKSENKKDEIEELFKKETLSREVKVFIVENNGRDVAPFFISLKETILNSDYEVIGHFHSKKSLAVDNSMGDKWRKFLLDTLIENEVISLFKDKKLGIVFPEDRHSVDYSSNKSFGDKICKSINIEPLENIFIYPLGTMFFARVKAIEPLFNVPKEFYNLKEPIPYDGSYLHAVERLLPYIAKKQGFHFKTIDKKDINW